MRPFFLLLLASLWIFAGASAQDINHVRAAMVRALNNRKAADSLYINLSATKNKSPLWVAYTGSAQALRARHAWNPYYKLKYVKAAEQLYAEAVHDDPHNIEIRFLRFSVEHYVPGFLGYSKNLIADRDEIITQLHNKNYATADNATLRTIINFMLESKRCTPQQETFLHQQQAFFK